jgi:3-oxoacyl-[acyl-carrier-protein] synthase II
MPSSDPHQRPRVVVTGMGVKTPAGQTTEDFWEGLLSGKSAAGPLTLYDASRHTVGFGCEVRDFDPEPYVGPK